MHVRTDNEEGFPMNIIFIGWWAKIIATFATIAVPLVIGFYGSKINEYISSNDRSLRYIEFAAQLLHNEKDFNIRDWAVDIINHYSPEVQISGALKQKIIGKGEIHEMSNMVGSGTDKISK